MKKISEFINSLPFPACVIDGAGKPAFLNPAMRKTASNLKSALSAAFCLSRSREGGVACGDCPHYKVTGGHCAIPRVLPSARLAMAAGLEALDGATIAFYTNETAPDPMDIHAAVGDILSMTGVSGRRGAHPKKSAAPGAWGANVRLMDLLKSAFEGLEFDSRAIEIAADSEAYMDFASLTAARLIIRRMAAELVNLKPAGSLKVRSFTKPEKRPPVHVISMQARVGRQAVKSLSSDISAMDMRLSGYCLRLGRMTGLDIPSPHTLMGGESADLRFELSGEFDPLSADKHVNEAASQMAGLSSRERLIVEMVAAGLNNDDISRKLGITVSTVKQHIKNIYKKTGARSRLDLVLQSGL